MRLVRRSSSRIALLVDSSLNSSSGSKLKQLKCAIYAFSVDELRFFRPNRVIDSLKRFAVIGVLEKRSQYEGLWGKGFEALASSFYVTGFRPLLVDFISVGPWVDVPRISEVLRRAYFTGILEEPVFEV